MSGGGPDLFVICKNCGSEVSPYITECPYCGNRLRKRAPKIDRDGRIAQRISRRPPRPSLSRLRRGEIPGIAHDAPVYVTVALVVLGIAGYLVWQIPQLDPLKLVIQGQLGRQWWRAFTAMFLYVNVGYAIVALVVVAIFGTLLERRHGPAIVLAIALIGGVGGMVVGSEVSQRIILGGNGAGLALLVAWAVPDLLRLARRHDFDGDLLGAAVGGCVLALMPLVTPFASWAAAATGAVTGLVLGYALARTTQPV